MYDELVKQLREAMGWRNASKHYELMRKAADAIEGLIDIIQNHDFLESLVKSEWIPAPEKGDCIYRCSQCGYEIDSYLCEAKNFCPNCGADMREES